MKTIGVIGTTILFLFFVASAPVFSQEREEPKPDEAKPAHQQEEKGKDKDKAKPEDKVRHEEGKHQEEQSGGLLTYFRKGRLQKFFLADSTRSQELCHHVSLVKWRGKWWCTILGRISSGPTTGVSSEP